MNGTVLAIDLGSTFLKAAVCAKDGTPLRRNAVRLAYDTGASGCVELPVERFDAAVTELLAGLRGEAPAAVAITSQAQTFAVFAADGRPKTAFVSWQDTSATSLRDGLAADPRCAGFDRHSSFPELHPQQMLCQVARLARAGQIAPGDHLLPLPSRLIGLLGGSPCLDTNLAAMTGLFSLATDGWQQGLIDAAGAGAARLPRLCRPGTRAATTSAVHGLNARTPIILAGNDQSAGAFAAGVQRGGRLIGLGTAQVAYRWLPALPDPVPGLVRGYFPGGGAYLMAVDEIGGNAITWAAEQLHMPAGDLLRLARIATPDCRCVRFEPTAGLGSGAGTWIGGPSDASAAERGRAVVLHLAERMRQLLARLGGDGPLLITGSEDKADWCAILTDSLAVPWRPVTADPLIGAARMSMVDA